MRNLGLLVLGIIAGSAIVLGVGKYVLPYTFKGSLIDPPLQAADFQLIDQHNEDFRLSDQKGKVVLAFFGYTHCPDECPITLANFKQVKSLLREKARQVRFVLITIDPERDNPDQLRQYLANFDPEFIGLTGETQVLQKVWQDYGVYEEKDNHNSETDYTVSHTNRVYAIDKRGNWRLTYLFNTPVKDIALDVGHLVGEK